MRKTVGVTQMDVRRATAAVLKMREEDEGRDEEAEEGSPVSCCCFGFVVRSQSCVVAFVMLPLKKRRGFDVNLTRINVDLHGCPYTHGYSCRRRPH